MGGHAAGEVASQEAVETVYGMVKRGISELHELVDPVPEDDARAACRLMESSVQAATYMVFGMAEMDRGKTGMGTTLSALLVLGDYAITAQVGDSRVYLIRDESCEQLTERSHPHRVAGSSKGSSRRPKRRSRRTGTSSPAPSGNHDATSRSTCPAYRRAQGGVRINTLLCSDGLHGYLRDREVAPIAKLGGEEAVRRFIELANERGGKDNITAILVEID